MQLVNPDAARGVIAAVAVAFFVHPSVVHAQGSGQLTVTFDDQPPGTVISTQYRDFGGSERGVEFGPTPPNPPEPDRLQRQPGVIETAGAHSAPHVGEILRDQRCIVAPDPECVPRGTVVWGRFPRAKQHVQAFVGDTIGSTSDTITLRAYDETGALIGTASADVQGGQPFAKVVRVETPDASRRIVFFSLTNSAFVNFGLDDLSFDDTPTPPEPGFSLRLLREGKVVLGQGGRVDVPIAVGRRNGSTGPIALRVDPATVPQGVRAAIVPEQAQNPNGETAVLTLEATSTAPPVNDAALKVIATPSPGAGTGDQDLRVPLDVISFDVAVQTIEVTQAVQVAALPQPTSQISVPDAGPGVLARYDGVPLAEAKRTVARVFVGALGTNFAVQRIPVLLRGFIRASDGTLRPLRESPRLPDFGPGELTAPFDLAVLRARADGAFTFTLPDRWTTLGRELVLAAEVGPPEAAPGLVECPGCRGNNVFALAGLRFLEQRTLAVAPQPLVFRRGRTEIRPADPARVFEDMRVVTPAPLRVFAPLPEIDVTDLVTKGDADPNFDVLGAILDRISETHEDNPPEAKTVGLLNDGRGGVGPGPFAATGSIDFGLDFIAHETYHTLGFKHASPACEAGGASGWPPDERGQIQGVGLDTRYSSGGPGLYRPVGAEEAGVFDATPNAPDEVHDFMSYCSIEDEGRTWISTKYWALAVRGFAPGGAIKLGTEGSCCVFDAPDDVTVAQVARGLRVTALVQPNAPARIERVEPVVGRPPQGVPGAEFEVVVRDSAGAVVSRTGVEPRQVASRPPRGRPEPPPSLYVNSVVAAPRAASVELVRGGVTIAARRRSVSAPRVRILSTSPRRVQAGDQLRIAWRTTDADGDAMRARVEFSADGGRTFRVIAPGLRGRAVTVPGTALPRTRRGRVRVVVNDGFNAAAAVSRRLRTEGRGPVVALASPRRGTRVNADAGLLLEATASDDRFRPIPGRRLVWRSGRRVLGRGERLTVAAARVSRRVVVEARDRFGRRRRRSVPVQIVPVAPFFVELEPLPLARRATTARLRVATSQPARLRVMGPGVRVSRRICRRRGGVRRCRAVPIVHRVGRRPRTLRVGVGRREAPRLRLDLTARGRTSRVMLPLTRRP